MSKFIDSFLQLSKGLLFIGFALIVFKLCYSLDFSKINELHVGSDGITLTLNEYKALKKSSDDILNLALDLSSEVQNEKKQMLAVNAQEQQGRELIKQATYLSQQINGLGKG